MAPYRNKQQNPLPSGFISIRDILNHKRGVGNLVNVIGVVKDFRTPAPTRGTGKHTAFLGTSDVRLLSARGLCRLEV